MLSIMLALITAFLLTIINEYTDSFVVTSVKNVAEQEIAVLALNQSCLNTTLVSLNFSKATSTMVLLVSGDCEVNASTIGKAVETNICGAKTPSGTGTAASYSFTCSGKTYILARSKA